MSYSFKTFRKRSVAERIALYASIAIALILAIAAFGKMFYPAEYLRTLDRSISVLEILFLLAIIFFRKRWEMWALASAIFASWGGYALYWYCIELPCACMGKMLNIPSAFSISFDAVFFALSLAIAFLLGARMKWIYFCILSGCIAFLMGYSCADCVYKNLF
jgi:hypothetical protein